MLTGLDVSRYQGTTPPLTNYAFLFARATFGLKVDSMFATHIANAKKAGIVTGAYHFGYSAAVARPEKQAQVFVALALKYGADLWALDLEGSSAPMTNAEAKAFIAEVHRLGYKIGLYGSRSGFPLSLGQDFDWIADWDSSVFPAHAELWQYRGSPLDLDKFNGTPEELLALAAIPPAEEVMQSFKIRPDTKAGTVTVNGPGHYYLRMSDGTLQGPINPATFGEHRAFGPVLPVPAIKGHDGEDAYLIGEMAALLLKADSNFVEDPTGFTQEQVNEAVAVAVAQDRAKAKVAVVYGD